jgi:hypothetical protein
LCRDAELGRQLNVLRRFRNERGKIICESKDQLRTRGIASPDRADALVFLWHAPRRRLIYIGA